MVKWLKYDKGSIFRDKSKNGLLSQFLKDYRAKFGGSINPSCGKCLAKYYDDFINEYSNKMENKESHGYVLKLKYNGIKSKTSGKPNRNADLTEVQAIDLIENHPHGKELFDNIPNSYYNKFKEVEEIKVEVEVVEPKKDIKRIRKAKK